ncbi:MAG: class I SAM-dependent DNA methyltransferase [Streptosporangiaceae bacterium]
MGPGGDAGQDQTESRYYKRDFWEAENLKFTEPHFRMRKVARAVHRVAQGRSCDLLDVGCGPAALARLMPAGVRYHGIDIAIHEPAPNLLEADILQEPVSFHGKRFDVIVAQGLFEYVGQFQAQKLAEIAGLLNPGGRFVVTYQNFAHRGREIYWPYSNVQPPEDFRADLGRHFRVERCCPVSHNWNHSQPNRKVMKAAQSRLSVNVPVISRILAVDYLYVCAPLDPAR